MACAASANCAKRASEERVEVRASRGSDVGFDGEVTFVFLLEESGLTCAGRADVELDGACAELGGWGNESMSMSETGGAEVEGDGRGGGCGRPGGRGMPRELLVEG